MIIKFISKTTFALIAMLSFNASAALISYDFSFELSGSEYLTGSFTAEDVNMDNYIRDSELVSISFSDSIYSIVDYTFSANDNFNFDVASSLFLLGGDSGNDNGQKWNNNGSGFGFGAGSYCAGKFINGGFMGCDAVPAESLVQTVTMSQPTSVPAPATLAMLAAGLLALRARRSSSK